MDEVRTYSKFWALSVVSLEAVSPQESQATLLLKKQQDLRIVDDALEYMKEEYRQRMEVRFVS